MSDSRVGQSTGLLLVGHGTRDPAGVAEFFALAELVAARLAGDDRYGDFVLAPCFLEIAQPDIATAFAQLMDRRVSSIIVMPLLLFAAGHAKRDIPAAVAQAAAAFDAVPIRQTAHLGCTGRVHELASERYHEALIGRTTIPAHETALLLVGRGSSDAEATAELDRLAKVRAAEHGLDLVEACFLAIARPSLTEALDAVAQRDVRRLVVQPYLLFGGLLLEELSGAVQEFAARHSQFEVVLTEHFGPAPAIAQAVVERISGVKIQTSGGSDCA